LLGLFVPLVDAGVRSSIFFCCFSLATLSTIVLPPFFLRGTFVFEKRRDATPRDEMYYIVFFPF